MQLYTVFGLAVDAAVIHQRGRRAAAKLRWLWPCLTLGLSLLSSLVWSIVRTPASAVSASAVQNKTTFDCWYLYGTAQMNVDLVFHILRLLVRPIMSGTHAMNSPLYCSTALVFSMKICINEVYCCILSLLFYISRYSSDVGLSSS